MSEVTRSITEYNDAELLSALELHDFHLGRAAAQLGVTRAALKDHVDRVPGLLVAMQDHEESMVDDAEAVIRMDLKANDSATAKFVAQTKGKKRGWGTAGVTSDGAIIVEVRSFPDPAAVGGGNGNKG